MSRPLSDQEIHNLAMNIVGKELEARGYEFIAVNSQLKKHPQFVCIDKNNQRYFIIIKPVQITEEPTGYDVVWMETFKNHARKQKAKVLFASVGLGNLKNKYLPPNLNEEYLLQFEGIQHLEVELN